MEKIPVFYSESMSIYDQSGISPSAFKPRFVVNSWLDQDMPIEIIAPTPVTTQEICLAHQPAYVQGVLSCRTENGFYTKSEEVAESLTFTSGSMLTAAKHALKTGLVACSPTSGFHHACYANGGGFCTFNGLMITALSLKQLGLVKKVGILDFDFHYGNGTDNIIKHLGLDWVKNITNENGYTGKVATAIDFLNNISGMLSELNDCDILLYQAGADAHINDPLGGFLTTAQMRQRDLTVFKEAKTWGIPIVWNLAGGYQIDLLDNGKKNIRKVLDLHDITMHQCIEVYITQTDLKPK